MREPTGQGYRRLMDALRAHADGHYLTRNESDRMAVMLGVLVGALANHPATLRALIQQFEAAEVAG